MRGEARVSIKQMRTGLKELQAESEFSSAQQAACTCTIVPTIFQLC